MPHEKSSPDRNTRLLTFEEFMEDRNNFHLHFAGEIGDHLVGDIYRAQSAYVKCRVENWSRFDRLARRITDALEHNRPCSHDQYEMYLMMFPYASCNRDMFM